MVLFVWNDNRLMHTMSLNICKKSLSDTVNALEVIHSDSLSDKIYRNRDNLNYCKERGIRLSGPALGRPEKNVAIDKKKEYKDNCDRVEVERAFSHAKGKFGLGHIRARLKETTGSAIALSIVALNLARIWCAFLLLLFLRFMEPILFMNFQKYAFVQ